MLNEGYSIYFSISDFILLKQKRLEQCIHLLQSRSGYTFLHSPDEGLDNLSETSSISSSERVRAWSQDATSPTSMGSNKRQISGSLLLSESMPSIGQSDSRFSSPCRSARSRSSSIGRSQLISGLTLTTSLSPEYAENAKFETTEEAYFADGEPIDSALENVARSFDDPLLTAMPTAESSPMPALGLADKLCVLSDELVCVGLNREYELSWREKLIQAFFYSDDVLPPTPEPSEEEPEVVDGLANYSPSIDDSSDLAQSTEFASLSASGYSTRNTSSHPSSRRRKPKTFADSIRDQAEKVNNILASTALGSLKQDNELLDDSPSTQLADHPTPFVSFTATQEGCSLTADIRLLRKLFVNDEGSIFAAGEGGLDALWIGEEGDERILASTFEINSIEAARKLQSRGRSRRRGSTMDEEDWNNLDDGRLGSSNASSATRSISADGSRKLLKCLQLDLSSFGLG